MILGCDVSFYESDSGGKIDFVRMKSAGMKFVIIRVGQNLWVDPSFSANWIDSKLAGFPRGSYWFYDSRIKPEEQASLWVKTMGNDFGELPLFADYEESYNGKYKGGENFKLFLEEIKRLLPNKEIIIYTGFWYFKDNVPTSLHPYFSQYKLWTANYGSSKPSIPPPFTDWEFWQYSEDGVGKDYGCNGGLDMDYYNGTLEQFNERFKIGYTSPETNQPKQDKLLSSKIYSDGVTLNSYEAYLSQGTTKYYVFDIEMTKVEFFVSPQLSSRMYVPMFLEKYKLNIAVNGDGFISTATTGFNSSEGKSYGKLGVEETLFINNKNLIERKIQNPIWNAISYPNRIVVDGKTPTINKERSDIRGRTAFGYNKEQSKCYLFVCDGKDYYSTSGMNFWDVSERLISLGCDYGVMLDSGGSTTMAVMDNNKPIVIGEPCGEDSVIAYEYPMRRVANVLGIRIKKTLPNEQESPETGEQVMDLYKAICDVKGTSIKAMDNGASLVTMQIGWEVEGELSALKTDIINITKYRKGTGMPDITLPENCKCSLAGLGTPVLISTTEPIPDPTPTETKKIVKLVAYFDDESTKTFLPEG